jgi:hypothetical protein
VLRRARKREWTQCRSRAEESGSQGYAKLYPSQLIEEYRKTVRSLYNAYYGEDRLKNPTAEEWAAFTASCNLRDMGTHLCALPTGEHCPKGLICLGCAHAQPKKSAVPIFRRMLASHERSLVGARSQRTCRTACGPRDGNCQDQGSIAESGGIER